MQKEISRKRVGVPSPAMIVAVVALVAALSGSAYAALGKNIVGPRQLKAKSVTTGKIANNAVKSRHVANGSLTGADINLSALGTVPSATTLAQAGNANTVTGHAAACPGGTTLIRGICFDSASNPVVGSVQQAADGCAAKGGYLPSPQELYSTRGVLNLGGGVGTDSQYTDTFYGNGDKESPKFRTIIINGTGALTEAEVDADAEYICAYPLVR